MPSSSELLVGIELEATRRIIFLARQNAQPVMIDELQIEIALEQLARGQGTRDILRASQYLRPAGRPSQRYSVRCRLLKMHVTSFASDHDRTSLSHRKCQLIGPHTGSHRRAIIIVRGIPFLIAPCTINHGRLPTHSQPGGQTDPRRQRKIGMS